MKHYFGAIEAGGTKFNCAIASTESLSSKPEIVREVRIATRQPNETLQDVIEFFRSNAFPIEALGIACFGPLDLNPLSQSFGNITTTPKPGWANTPIRTTLMQALGVPASIDTDVNGAALGEFTWGSHASDSVLYLTFGTGIGGGFISKGHTLHGLTHPEMGHIFIPKHKEDNYAGNCPYHQDRCLEGLASGPAMEKRWGKAAEKLPTDHIAWRFEVFYIAQALVNYILTLSPQKIVLGGGLMNKDIQLIERIRTETQRLLNGYIQHDAITQNIERFIVTPCLKQYSAIYGALELAKQAYRSK